MTPEQTGGSHPAIACSLTPGQVAAMGHGLLPGLVIRAQGREPIPGGFRWRFDPDPGLLNDAATVIEAERRCCRFLSFGLRIEADGGPVWLEVTGPSGTEGFLTALLQASGPPQHG